MTWGHRIPFDDDISNKHRNSKYHQVIARDRRHFQQRISGVGQIRNIIFDEDGCAKLNISCTFCVLFLVYANIWKETVRMSPPPLFSLLFCQNYNLTVAERLRAYLAYETSLSS